jgi:hypothetical protein
LTRPRRPGTVDGMSCRSRNLLLGLVLVSPLAVVVGALLLWQNPSEAVEALARVRKGMTYEQAYKAIGPHKSYSMSRLFSHASCRFDFSDGSGFSTSLRLADR